MKQGPPEDAPGLGDDGRDDALLAQLTALRRSLARSVAETGERVQETVEDAVRRGRMTRKDASELAAAIVAASRRQTDEIRQEIEALLERGRRTVGKGGTAGAGAALPEAVAIPIEREGGGERTLPIERYDELTAVLVRKSLTGLSDDELRAVREHEVAHANRKTVLAAVDRLLDA
ncbi:hypothetical protein [Patulibacter sp.]|uniref:hypothetical protein n=1 Tax=Patulibacter sp. TaxID=1912859 RepID=UPI00271843BF|nr:hypothetical protein [Patulibacter sp.]MDO9407588.1 hypothetical protein [Patulibacter sp.]